MDGESAGGLFAEAAKASNEAPGERLLQSVGMQSCRANLSMASLIGVGLRVNGRERGKAGSYVIIAELTRSNHRTL